MNLGTVLQTSKGFWVFLFHVNHPSGCGVAQITTQRAHQFRALERRERKSFNRTSKEVEELRLIYNFFRFSVERLPLPSRKRTQLVTPALCCDLRYPASTQMIDGTEKKQNPVEVCKACGAGGGGGGARRGESFNSKGG